MKINEIKINIGAEKPFQILHFSDNHLTFADSRDCERKISLGESRSRSFLNKSGCKTQAEHLDEMLAYAKENNLTIVHTGDMIDFVSKANLDYVKNVLEGHDYFMAAGNHEYSQFVGEAWEDENYKHQSFDAVCAAYPGDIWYQVRMIGGIKFIAIDNNYYYITEKQFRRFREDTADGVPVVLVVHNPIYSPDTYNVVMDGVSNTVPPYLFGCPELLLRELEDHRYRQQKPDDLTSAFVEFCEKLPNLKCILAGHLHKYSESKLISGVPQYVAGAGYNGEANLYTFI